MKEQYTYLTQWVLNKTCRRVIMKNNFDGLKIIVTLLYDHELLPGETPTKAVDRQLGEDGYWTREEYFTKNIKRAY